MGAQYGFSCGDIVIVFEGGLISIIRIDVVSFWLILILYPLCLYYTWQMPFFTGASGAFSAISLPADYIVSLVVLTMFSYISAPWYAQKIMAAKGPKTAYWAVVWAAIIICLLYGCVVYISGLLGEKGYVLEYPDLSLPYIIRYALPAWTQGAAYAVLFAVGATTLAGVWSAMMTFLVRKKTPDQNKYIVPRQTILLTLLCSFCSLLGANLFVDNVLHKMILANIPVVAVSFSLLAGFYWRGASCVGAYASIATGIAWGIGCYMFYGEGGGVYVAVGYLWYTPHFSHGVYGV